MTGPDDILHSWFPPNLDSAGLDSDEETHRRQFAWWLRGGARSGDPLKALIYNELGRRSG